MRYRNFKFGIICFCCFFVMQQTWAAEVQKDDVYIKSMSVGDYNAVIYSSGTSFPDSCGQFRFEYKNSGSDCAVTDCPNDKIAVRKAIDLLMYAKVKRNPVNLTYEPVVGECSNNQTPPAHIYSVEIVFGG